MHTFWYEVWSSQFIFKINLGKITNRTFSLIYSATFGQNYFYLFLTIDLNTLSFLDKEGLNNSDSFPFQITVAFARCDDSCLPMLPFVDGLAGESNLYSPKSVSDFNFISFEIDAVSLPFNSLL